MARQKHRLTAGKPRELRREQANHPAANDKDAFAGHGRTDVKAMQRARKRLAEGAMQRVKIRGERHRLSRREHGIFRETAVAMDACGDVAFA